jgi:hypothetical protein
VSLAAGGEMEVNMKLKVGKFKKILPLVQQQPDKPLHAGELYYLWEGLTLGQKLMSALETYMMNTEDSELHFLLKGLISGNDMVRVKTLEKTLKDYGFTVPPQPPTKIKMGKPGAGQEVKLTDEEVISNLIAWGQIALQADARAIGACNEDSIRKIFISLLFKEMDAYSLIMDLGNRRQVYKSPPTATARDNGLNMGEVFALWEELGARHLSIINAETFLSSTTDKDLAKMLERLINTIATHQLEQLENKLKEEGFTVPARPIRRLNQAPIGEANKIKIPDDEFLGLILCRIAGGYSRSCKSLLHMYQERFEKYVQGFCFYGNRGTSKINEYIQAATYP